MSGSIKSVEKGGAGNKRSNLSQSGASFQGLKREEDDQALKIFCLFLSMKQEKGEKGRIRGTRPFD